MIDRKLKDQLGEGSDSSEEDDLENGLAHKPKQKMGKFWCKHCQIEKEAQTEHCSDCMVCI